MRPSTARKLATTTPRLLSRSKTTMPPRRERGPPNPIVRISKALSYTLRHGALKEGLPIDASGYVPVAALLAHPKYTALALDLPTLLRVVAENDKQRFALTPDNERIRASQGHSLDIDSLALDLKPWQPLGTAVHGTFYGAYEQILQSGGLKRMGRRHVHLAPEDEWTKGGVISGMRGDAKVVFYVDAQRASEEGGVKFWKSENGVVLTEGVGEEGLLDMKWVTKVVDRDAGDTLWEGGKVVKELPENKKGRGVPRGKEHVHRGRGGRDGRGGRGGRDGRGGRGSHQEAEAGEASSDQGVGASSDQAVGASSDQAVGASSDQEVGASSDQEVGANDL